MLNKLAILGNLGEISNDSRLAGLYGEDFVSHNGAHPMKNTVISDLDIQALADGELEGKDKIRVETALDDDIQLRKRYDQIMSQRRMIAMIWRDDEQASKH